MAHQSLVASEPQIAQLLTQVLGQSLSTQEWSDCSQYIEILEPAAGKLIWQSITASPGLYLILKGRVRLLDSTNNLVISLAAGASLGETTLFPVKSFQAYAARASVNVQLCFVPEVGVCKVDLASWCMSLLVLKFNVRGQRLRRALQSYQQLSVICCNTIFRGDATW